MQFRMASPAKPSLLLHLRRHYVALHNRMGLTLLLKGKPIMRANSYETTLAYVNALNRSPRKISALQWTTWFLGRLREAISLASAYKELTHRGVAPEAAVRRVFDTVKR